MIEEALVSHLLADSEVTTLAGTRVLRRRPQKPSTQAALPAVSCWRIDTVRPRHLTAPLGRPDARVQVDCYALTSKAAKELANAVRVSKGTGLVPLESLRGDWQGYTVDRIALEDERDTETRTEHGEQVPVYVTSLDLLIRFHESTS